MKSSIYRKLPLLFALLMASSALGSRAQETGNILFSHDGGRGVMALYGTEKAESYDVAILLPGATMKGLTISGVRVPMSTDAVEKMSVWLSKELKVEVIDKKRVNVPDIASQSATPQIGWTEVTFEQPYTITEEGVHVGYSFEVAEADESNLRPVVVTTDLSSGGFFARTSRSFRSWEDRSSLCTSCLQVIISGAKGDAAAVGSLPALDAGAGVAATLTLPVVNHGFNGVKNFNYTYELDGHKESGFVDLAADSIRGRYQLTKNVEIPLLPIDKKGEHPLTVSITKVNGIDNADPAATAQTMLTVYGSLPKHRAVMEEYTGGWCGYCPRGMVAMEMLAEQYPADFIGLAYHNGDPMEVTADFPSEVSSFPMCHIDRASGGLDPFLGTGRQGTSFEIEQIWADRCKVTAPASVEVEAELSTDGTTVAVDATVSFPIPTQESGYKLEFVLVADSLTGTAEEGWYQVNYFSGDKNYSRFEKMLPFVNGEQYLFGLVYNDVVVASSRLQNEDAQLPAEIKLDERIPLSYRFDLAKVQNAQGKPVIQDKRRLRVVALLIAPDGSIANANQTKVDSEAYSAVGLETVRTSASGPQHYDLLGRRIAAPQRGIHLQKFPDGTVRKVIIK